MTKKRKPSIWDKAVEAMKDAPSVLVANEPVTKPTYEELEKQLADALDDVEHLKRIRHTNEHLIAKFEPAAYAACETPPKRCKCKGCMYRREWESSNK